MGDLYCDGLLSPPPPSLLLHDEDKQHRPVASSNIDNHAKHFTWIIIKSASIKEGKNYCIPMQR